MFQKNFLGVKYLTQNFQKKRHLAASRLRPIRARPRRPPRVSPPATPMSAFASRHKARLRDPQTNLKTNASIAYTIVAAKIPFAVLSLCELM